MFFLRLILILGVLMHPFCSHCFAEMQAMAKAVERLSEVEIPANADWTEDSSSTGSVCTKAPLRTESGLNLNLLLQGDLVQALPMPSVDLSGARYDSVSPIVVQHRPLYLSLAVLLI